MSEKLILSLNLLRDLTKASFSKSFAKPTLFLMDLDLSISKKYILFIKLIFLIDF